MFSENADYVDEQFRRWQQDPNSVEPTWQGFFAGMQFAGRLPGGGSREAASGVSADVRVQTGVVRLVFWYRQAGHLQAHTDPLADGPPPPNPLLALEHFGLSDADLDRTVDGSMIFGFDGPIVLRDLLDLYADVDSKHSIEAVGCTSCHDGSGQETDFVVTAHMPRPWRSWPPM